MSLLTTAEALFVFRISPDRLRGREWQAAMFPMFMAATSAAAITFRWDRATARTCEILRNQQAVRCCRLPGLKECEHRFQRRQNEMPPQPPGFPPGAINRSIHLKTMGRGTLAVRLADHPGRVRVQDSLTAELFECYVEGAPGVRRTLNSADSENDPGGCSLGTILYLRQS